jgi:ElaB/YqjD/DUF883 family membrane-anchored ribosome-binding protein
MVTKHKHHHDYDLYDDLEKIKAAIADATRDVKGKTNQLIAQSIDNVKEKSTDLQENLGHYVEKKPFKSLGIAVFIGLVVGYLLHKK